MDEAIFDKSDLSKIEFGNMLDLAGHTSFINSVAISHDAKKLVSGSKDMTIQIWNLETGCKLNTLKGHANSVSSVAISNDSKKIVSRSWDKTIKVWNLETGKQI